MILEGKVLGNRYEIIQKVGNGRNGNSIQSTRYST